MDIQETWRPTPLAPDHVEVSDRGRVRTLDRVAVGMRNGVPGWQIRRGKILAPWVSKNGYLTVSIKVAPHRVKYLVHRLVASAFCEGFDPALSVNHKDCNKLHNLPCNLEWVTLARNTEHQWENGLVNLRGESHPGSKLTDDQARHIKKAMLAGVSPTVLARAVGVSISLCYKIKEGTRHNC